MTRAAPARSAARWQVKGPRCEDASWRLALVRVGFFLWRGCELGFWQGVVVPTRACAGGPPSDFDRAYLKMLISFYFYGGAQISCRARGPPNCREGDRHTPRHHRTARRRPRSTHERLSHRCHPRLLPRRRQVCRACPPSAARRARPLVARCPRAAPRGRCCGGMQGYRAAS